MLWTAPTTGIAMCQNAVDVAERLESAFGYKQTFSRPKSTSALPPGADIPAPTPAFSLTPSDSPQTAGLVLTARLRRLNAYGNR
jgi:hypothetical protein